ncbi:MAG: hypothetical protein JWM04_783 [Verrucomicrobiales bacterium]|nr:hypothetical protein [Verrucomicrobiales bacterium]
MCLSVIFLRAVQIFHEYGTQLFMSNLLNASLYPLRMCALHSSPLDALLDLWHPRRMKFVLRFSAVLLLFCIRMPEAKASPLEFNRDIRPILSENCFFCHGQDPARRKSKLRLDEREGALRDLEGHSAIVPGHPEKSEMLVRLLSHDEEEQMPPAKSNRRVSPEQIAMLKRWIAEGAPYEKHWAFIPPRRASLPPVKNKKWAKSTLDLFVIVRLEKEGLKPSPETKPETWLRRVSFDLTGLPPTVQELDAFAKNVSKRGEKAYSEAVDRLLASPHFGERQAIDWLDAARYADTHGFNNDSARSMWRWRDWVIDSFNANLPYDRFITEQLAGDLLPGPSVEQRIATGFSRNHVINSEGGVIDEEYRVEYVADRVRTTSTAWLGLTMECARCHDHKFDPIKQRDYYRLFAFFNSVPEHGEDGRVANAVPIMPAPTKEQQQTLAQQLRELSEMDRQLSGTLAHASPNRDEIQTIIDRARMEVGTNKSISLVKGEFSADGIVGNSTPLGPDKPAPNIAAKNLNFVKPDGSTLSLWIKPGQENSHDVPLLSSLDYSGSTADAGYGKGRELRLIDGEAEWRDSVRYPVYARVIRSEGANISPGQWSQVVVTVATGKSAAAVRIFLDGVELPTRTRYDGLSSDAPSRDFLVGADNSTNSARFQGEWDEVRFFPSALSSVDIRARFETDALPLAVKSPDNPQSKKWFRAALLNHDESSKNIITKRLNLWGKHLALRRELPTVMVMEELSTSRPSFILTRGNYDAHGESVMPGVPEDLIAPWPQGAPTNRLGLAQWFTQPGHPLTSRVVVNRFWAQLFGVGLVKTLEDFGSQSEWPSHPEVLDLLARDFVDGGWNVKSLLKTIVLSSTYRQSSDLPPGLFARDPENRLLARGPRVRLPAELIRDQALTISGLLTDKIGGPSVFPYQPEKLYDGVVVGADYPGTRWLQSKNEDLYRRSLYTFWKRTVPNPAMLSFDAPDREFCTVRRSRTNTPLQALLLWNETGYLEAARHLAGRMIHEGGKSDSTRVAFAFQLATGRKPTFKEAGVLLHSLEKLRADFTDHSEEAAAFLKVGDSAIDTSILQSELAAMTGVASMILNLDETITKN